MATASSTIGSIVCSVRCRRLHAIDHQHVYWTLRRLEFQPELFLNSREDGRGSGDLAGQERTLARGPPVDALELGQVREIEIERSGEARAIEDWPLNDATPQDSSESIHGEAGEREVDRKQNVWKLKDDAGQCGTTVW